MKENPLNNLTKMVVTTPTFPSSSSPSVSSNLPTFFDVEKPFKQMSAYPALLYTDVVGASDNVVVCIGGKIEDISVLLQQIADTIDSLLITFQKSINIQNPEKEWSDRIKAVFREYSIFFWKLMLQALDSIIPFNLLEAPLPLLPENTIGDMFSEVGRASIQTNISNNIVSLTAILPEPFKSMFNKETISTEWKAVQIYEYIGDLVTKSFLEAAKVAIEAVADSIDVILDSLFPPIDGTPTLEDLGLIFNFSSLPPDPTNNLEVIDQAAKVAKDQFLSLIFSVVPTPPNVPYDELTLRKIIEYNVEQTGDTFEEIVITISDATFGIEILPGPIFGINGFTISDFINVEMDEILDETPSTMVEVVQVYPLTIINVLLELLIIPAFPPFIPTDLRLEDIIGMTLDDELSTSNTVSVEVIKSKIMQLAPISALMITSKVLMDWFESLKNVEIDGDIYDLLGLLIGALPNPLKVPFYLSDLLDILFSPIGGFPPVPPDLSVPCN